MRRMRLDDEVAYVLHFLLTKLIKQIPNKNREINFIISGSMKLIQGDLIPPLL